MVIGWVHHISDWFLHNWLVWTQCLMHGCVCVYDSTYYKITTTNYISKISLYTTFRMCPSACWPLKILMFALLVTCEIATYSWPWEKTGDNKYMLGLLLILILKSWGCPPQPGMPFLDSIPCAEGGLFISARVSFPVWCHPWMYDRTNGWMDGKLHEIRPRRLLLYVITVSYGTGNNEKIVSWSLSSILHGALFTLLGFCSHAVWRPDWRCEVTRCRDSWGKQCNGKLLC